MAERTPEEIAAIVAEYDNALIEAGGDIEALTDWAVSAKNKLKALDLRGLEIALLKRETQLIANRDQLADDRQAFDKEKEAVEKPGAGGPEGESRAESERRKIFELPFEATMEELEAMTPAQYVKWQEAGSHVKTEEKTGAELSVEEAARRTVEADRIETMPMAQYAAEREREREEIDGKE